jgi:nitroreductase
MPLIPAGELHRTVLAGLRVREVRPDQAWHRRPATTWPLASADDALARRRAVREFSDDAVASQDVATIVERAREAERVVWPADAHGMIRYTILVAAYRITGLAPGLYLTSGDSTTGAFSKLAADPWPDSLRLAYNNAAFLVLICADISAASQPGAPGYGPLLIRAGTLGYAAWLSAISLGLAGCVYAGPHHRVTEAVRRLDGRSNHVFTASLGRRAAQ